VTPQATPVWARINAQGSDGAFIRKEPKYTSEIVIVLLNGIIVEVLPDVIIEGNATWVKVRLTDGKEGWIVRSLLATATPAPNW
jgi:SH3-like domain-containing protein